MNQDERRAKIIVQQNYSTIQILGSESQKEFDKLFQEFVSSDYRKDLGDQKPYALAVAFALWLEKKLKADGHKTET